MGIGSARLSIDMTKVIAIELKTKTMPDSLFASMIGRVRLKNPRIAQLTSMSAAMRTTSSTLERWNSPSSSLRYTAVSVQREGTSRAPHAFLHPKPAVAVPDVAPELHHLEEIDTSQVVKAEPHHHAAVEEEARRLELDRPGEIEGPIRFCT